MRTKLTERQREVALLAAGNVSKAVIARRLQIKVATVASHMARVYAKLHLHSRIDLARYRLLLV